MFLACLLAKEKQALLKKWVSSNENLAACEHAIAISRQHKIKGKRQLALVPVKDMSKPPYNFNELLIRTMSTLYCSYLGNN